MKKILSLFLAFVMTVSVPSFVINAATKYNYSPSAALEYAANHWNDGVGLCAEFVWNCVKAGGINISKKTTTRACFNGVLDNSYATRYQLKLNSQGRAMKADNSAILSPGDVVVQYCTTCDLYPHIILFSKYDSNGNALYYAHNSAMNNKMYTLNKNSQHKSSCNIIAYVAHFPQDGNIPTPTPTPTPTPSTQPVYSPNMTFSKSTLNLDVSSKSSETITLSLSGSWPAITIQPEASDGISWSWGDWYDNETKKPMTIYVNENAPANSSMKIHMKEKDTGKVLLTRTITINVTKPVAYSASMTLSSSIVDLDVEHKPSELIAVRYSGTWPDFSMSISGNQEGLNFKWYPYSLGSKDLKITADGSFIGTRNITLHMLDAEKGTELARTNLTINITKPQPQTYTLSYDSRGGVYTPESVTGTAGQYAVVNHETYMIRSGYEFLGWSTNPNATKGEYKAQDRIKLDRNIVLYAIWGKTKINLEGASELKLTPGEETYMYTVKQTGEYLDSFQDYLVQCDDEITYVGAQNHYRNEQGVYCCDMVFIVPETAVGKSFTVFAMDSTDSVLATKTVTIKGASVEPSLSVSKKDVYLDLESNPTEKITISLDGNWKENIEASFVRSGDFKCKGSWESDDELSLTITATEESRGEETVEVFIHDKDTDEKLASVTIRVHITKPSEQEKPTTSVTMTLSESKVKLHPQYQKSANVVVTLDKSLPEDCSMFYKCDDAVIEQGGWSSDRTTTSFAIMVENIDADVVECEVTVGIKNNKTNLILAEETLKVIVDRPQEQEKEEPAKPAPQQKPILSVSKQDVYLDLETKPSEIVNVTLGGYTKKNAKIKYATSGDFDLEGTWISDNVFAMTIEADEKYGDTESITLYMYDRNTDEEMAKATVTLHITKPEKETPKDEITVYVDGVRLNFDVPPMLINNRTMVPMRAIFEALGAKVSWDNKTWTAIGEMDGKVIEIGIGKDYLYRNGRAVALDSPAQIISGRTLVPVRAISENLDCTVEWDGKLKRVIITSMPASGEESASGKEESLSGGAVPEGEYRIASKLDSDLVLDIAGSVHLATATGGREQVFELYNMDGEHYKIIHVSTGKVLGVLGTSGDWGTVGCMKYIGDPLQLWRLEDAGDGSYYIINQGTGLYLDVDNACAEEDAAVQLFTRNDAYEAQNWILFPNN